jgi:hypothetical protein
MLKTGRWVRRDELEGFGSRCSPYLSPNASSVHTQSAREAYSYN